MSDNPTPAPEPVLRARLDAIALVRAALTDKPDDYATIMGGIETTDDLLELTNALVAMTRAAILVTGRGAELLDQLVAAAVTEP